MNLRLLLAVLLAGCGLADTPTDPDAPAVTDTADPSPDSPPDPQPQRDPESQQGPEPEQGPEPGQDPDPQQNPAECPEGVRMGDYYGKVVVPVTIDGHRFEFIYDTGAPTSVVDLSVAATIGDGPHVIEVAGEQTEMDVLPEYDLSSIGQIEGVLGNDVVGEFVVSMDYGRRQFWLSEQVDEAAFDACDHLTGEPTTVDFLYEEFLFVEGAFETRAGWLLLDSGASLGVVVQPVFDELQAQRNRVAIPGFYTPALIGTFWAELTTLGSVTVGDHQVENIVSRTIPEGLIQVPAFPDGGTFLGVAPSGFLQHHVVTIDFENRTIRLDRLADSTGREPVDFFPFGYGLAEDLERTEVAYLVPGGSAERVGMQIGDEVLAVDGRSVGTIDASTRSWMTVGRVPGQTSSLRVRRDDEELNFELTAENLLEFGN